MSEVQIKILDNETRKKLAEAGALGFTESKEFLFSPDFFREVDDKENYKLEKALWPVFKLQGKDGIEASDDINNAGYAKFDKEGNRSWVDKTPEIRRKSLQSNVKGWKNLYDTEGKEIVFETDEEGMVKLSLLKRIPATWLINISNAIQDNMTLTPEEVQGLEF